MIAYSHNHRSGDNSGGGDLRSIFLSSLFSRLQLPFAAFNPRGEIIYSNDLFNRLDLSLLGSNKAGRNLRVQSEALAATVKTCLAEDKDVLLAGAAAKQNYVLDFRPLHDFLPGGASHSLVILIAYRLGEFRLASQDSLRQLYAMTAREADIIKLLLTGHSITQIAQHHSVSVGTVRVQLKSIFRKAGVSRQSELFSKLCY